MIEALIKELETATEGSHELNCKIEAVRRGPGWECKVMEPKCAGASLRVVGPEKQKVNPPIYTQSLDAACCLLAYGEACLEAMNRRRQPEMGGRMFSCTIIRAGLRYNSGGQRSYPLAICVAAVKSFIDAQS